MFSGCPSACQCVRNWADAWHSPTGLPSTSIAVLVLSSFWKNSLRVSVNSFVIQQRRKRRRMIERSGGGRHQRQFWARAGSRPVCAAASCTVPAGSGSEWRLVCFLTGIIRHSVIHLPPSLPIHPALSACLREFRCFPVAGGKGVPGIFVGGGVAGVWFIDHFLYIQANLCVCVPVSLPYARLQFSANISFSFY